MQKIIYLTPHLSTGGMPQFLLTRLLALNKFNNFEIYVVEYTQYSDKYVSQRNKIINLLGDRFYSAGYINLQNSEERSNRLLAIIKDINPDIIHIDECPEAFDNFNKLSLNFIEWLYMPTHKWKIVETCHNIWFNGKNKIFEPDAYFFCTPYHLENNFKDNNALKTVIEYPIINIKPTYNEKIKSKQKLGIDLNKIHILNIGLWTPGKNQKEGIEIAKFFNDKQPDKYQFHFVGNQAENFKEYWEPILDDLPSNVKIWGERQDTELFYKACDIFMFNSTLECNPLVLREAISYGLISFSRNLPQYSDMFTQYIIELKDDLSYNANIMFNTINSFDKIDTSYKLKENDISNFGKKHIEQYKFLSKLPKKINKELNAKFRLDFKGRLKLHCERLHKGEWRADFIKDGSVFYKANNLETGHWYSPSPQWWADWTVNIYRNNILYESLSLTLKGKQVLVNFESSSLGDTIAWMGQMLRYKNIMGIEKLWVKTYKNWLFNKEEYSKRGIELITNKDQSKAEVEINLGVFYSIDNPWKKDRHPNDWRQQPLIKIATDQLGITYKEEKPLLSLDFKNKSLETNKKIVIATKSTAQAKLWNNPSGWNDLVKWHIDNGYKVMHASKEGYPPVGSIQLKDDLKIVAEEINSSEYFIGLSSGLSWFAWALNAKVVLISGFTPEWIEFSDNCLRIINKNNCWGCWSFNTFDKNDWNWCPSHKNTNRQFECSKHITAEYVINKINNWNKTL